MVGFAAARFLTRALLVRLVLFGGRLRGHLGYVARLLNRLLLGTFAHDRLCIP